MIGLKPLVIIKIGRMIVAGSFVLSGAIASQAANAASRNDLPYYAGFAGNRPTINGGSEDGRFLPVPPSANGG